MCLYDNTRVIIAFFIWVTLVKCERIGDKNMKLNGHDRKETVYLYS